MAEQRGHLSNHGQAGGGLQPVLAGPREVFVAFLLADVEHRAHPAGVAALGIDEGRLHDEHWKSAAVTAQKDRLLPAAQHRCVVVAVLLPLLVQRHHLGRPVGRLLPAVEQLLGLKANHLAKRRIDISDLALQVTRPQTGAQ